MGIGGDIVSFRELPAEEQRRVFEEAMARDTVVSRLLRPRTVHEWDIVDLRSPEMRERWGEYPPPDSQLHITERPATAEEIAQMEGISLEELELAESWVRECLQRGWT